MKIFEIMVKLFNLLNLLTERGIIQMDNCIYCGNELSKLERTRCECWECRDKTIESYEEDTITE